MAGGEGGELAMKAVVVSGTCEPEKFTNDEAMGSRLTQFCSLTLAVMTADCVSGWALSQQE